MSVKVDGTNGLLQAYDYQVLTTGFSYTFAAGTQTLVINPAGTLATGTIIMPASPVDGMVITIESTQQITAVTVQGNTGQTITGAPTQLIPNQPLSFMYNLANTKWQPFAGGAGRATSIVSGTAVTSTSGTSIDFTGIPSWVKRITVSLSAVSTNGSNPLAVQIGDSGGVETTGYNGSTSYNSGAGVAVTALSNASSFYLNAGASSYSLHGSFTLVLVDSATNTWACVAYVSTSSTNVTMMLSGSKALSATLDRVRVTTSTGTDAFDAGLVNILYE